MLVLLAATLAGTRPVAAADWSTWQRYMEAAQRAWEQGRLSGAEQWLQEAVHEAEQQDPKSPQLARALTALAEVYRKQGRESEARALAPRIDALTRASAADGPSVIERLQAYAALLHELGRDVDARTVDARVQLLRGVEAGGSGGQLLFFNPVAELRDYAALLHQRNRDAEARAVEVQAAAEAAKLIERYEKLRQGFSGPAALPTLTWLQQMTAGNEALDGRLYPEAEALFRDAATTAETFGAQDARLSLTLSRLAFVVRAQGKREEFTRLVQRVMPMLESIAGTHHALLPSSLNVLASAHLRFSFEGGEALAYFSRALPLLEKDVRADHPAVGLQVAGLAASYLALKQQATAQPLVERALAIATAQSSAEAAVPAVGLLAIVRLYRDGGDYARADALAERVVAVLRRTLPPEHPDLVYALALRRDLQARLARPAAVASLRTVTHVPLDVAGDALLVHGVVNRAQHALFLLDTGATVTSLRPVVLQRLGVTVPADARRQKFTLVGGTTVEVPLVAVSLQIGDAVVENLDVAIVEAAPGAPDIDGLLGGNFLQRFKVILERSSRRLTLEPLTP
jgi:tetratricopeptide (TPR) repeat protein